MISNAKQTNRKRPVGVTLLAILLGTYAVLMFVATGWAWAHPEEVHSWMTPENNIEIAMGVVIFTPLKMLMAAVLCFSLWNLQDWAGAGPSCWARSACMIEQHQLYFRQQPPRMLQGIGTLLRI